MVHLLLYADVWTWKACCRRRTGRGAEPHPEVIDRYARDYPNLSSHSDATRNRTRCARSRSRARSTCAATRACASPTEGSDWIVERARPPIPGRCYVLVWGGLEDLAQALHDAPDILPKLRVYFIGGPNKKWSPTPTIHRQHHPALWMIEANSTYNGWFVGGDQTGDRGNASFVTAHVAGRGALGDYFVALLGRRHQDGRHADRVQAVARYSRGSVAAQLGWALRAGLERPFATFERLTTAADRIEHFAILELVLPLGDGAPANPEARLVVENQSLVGHVDDARRMRFRFSPKEAKTYTYTIRGNVPSLEGRTGAITSVYSASDAAKKPSANLPRWWADDPAPAAAEGVHHGAGTVSQWRREFLADFAVRLERARCRPRPADRASLHPFGYDSGRTSPAWAISSNDRRRVSKS